MLLYKTKGKWFWRQQAFAAWESGDQNEYSAIIVNEHLSPLNSVFKMLSAVFAGIFFSSLPF